MEQNIFLIGLNHKTADVEIRERFALSECLPEMDAIIPVGGPDNPVAESLVLSTCNRVEILAVGHGDAVRDRVLSLWAEARGQTPGELEPFVYVHKDLDAVKHVFTVASSLDSMVVGEPQILGQLKDAYRESVKRNTSRVILNRLLHKAFSVAKRVRTETAIGSSAVSISYAAVELARRIFADMSQRSAMLIGAGEMAELAATHLLSAGLRKIFVANRTFSRAEELARQFEGEPLAFEELFEHLHEVDIVISSTGSPSAVIRAKDIKHVIRKRRHRPMFFIDIAVPRDIDPDVNGLDNIYLYDIDDLREVVEENLAQRKGEAARARGIVESETESFGQWLKSLELQPTIVDLLAYGEDIGQREVAKTLKRLGPDTPGEVREALEVMARSMVGKLYHEPIMFLRRRSMEEEPLRRYIDVTRRMFNLDDDPDRDDAHQDRKKNP